MSRLKTIINNSIKNILESASKDKKEDFVIVVNSHNLIAEMNNVLAEIDGNLPPIIKKAGSISTFLIKPSSYNKLINKYKFYNNNP